MCQCRASKINKCFLFRFQNNQALFIYMDVSPGVAGSPTDQCPVLCFLPSGGDPCLGGLASSHQASLDWTRPGALSALSSPHLATYTPSHTQGHEKKTQKCPYP